MRCVYSFLIRQCKKTSLYTFLSFRLQFFRIFSFMISSPLVLFLSSTNVLVRSIGELCRLDESPLFSPGWNNCWRLFECLHSQRYPNKYSCRFTIESNGWQHCALKMYLCRKWIKRYEMQTITKTWCFTQAAARFLCAQKTIDSIGCRSLRRNNYQYCENNHGFAEYLNI